jgi:hypothetical protein
LGKNKKKSRSEIEFLRGKIKHLEKKLKQFQKEGPPREEEPDIDEDVDEICEHCGKGRIQIVDLKFVIFKVCELCHKREKIEGN